MAYNFNRAQSNDYNTKAKQINELINLFGISADFLYTSKEGQDLVLRDFQYLKLKPDESRKVMVMPENSDEFDGEIQFGMFGIENLQTTNLFISRKTILRLYPDWDEESGLSGIVNNLLVFPSGNIQEITNCELQVPGINNIFLADNEKSSYLLSTRAYYNSKQNEIKEEPKEEVTESMDDLDSYFSSLEETQTVVTEDADEISDVDSVFGALG